MKKSYTGFIIFMVVFVAVIIAMCTVPFADENLRIRLLFNFTAIILAVLMFYIYKTDKVYLINTVSYEEIEKAGYERRQWFAWKLFKRFAIFALGYLVLSVIMHLIGLSMLIDIAVFAIGIFAVSISCTTVKL